MFKSEQTEVLLRFVDKTRKSADAAHSHFSSRKTFRHELPFKVGYYDAKIKRITDAVTQLFAKLGFLDSLLCWEQ